MVNPFHFKYTQNKSPQQMGHNGNQPNEKQNAMKIQCQTEEKEEDGMVVNDRETLLENKRTLQNGL